MKGKIIAAAAAAVLLGAWAIRVAVLNGGRLLPYPMYPQANYSLGEAAPFHINEFHLQASGGDCTVTLTDAAILDQTELQKRYPDVNIAFAKRSDAIIVCDLHLVNPTDADTLAMMGTNLRGADWSVNPREAGMRVINAGNPAWAGEGIIVPAHGESDITMVYCISKKQFPASRWEHFREEPMWLIATLLETEERLVVNPGR